MSAALPAPTAWLVVDEEGSPWAVGDSPEAADARAVALVLEGHDGADVAARLLDAGPRVAVLLAAPDTPAGHAALRGLLETLDPTWRLT